MGIVGPRHEPPLFFGVERPNVEKYILPSTWSVDGVGLTGDLSENISYEVYAVGGLNASGFTTTDGIRGGREAAYQSLEKPSITGRVDYYGIDGLRVGASMWSGSSDFGTKGVDVGDGTEVSISSLDFEYEAGALSVNGLWASGEHDGNGNAGTVAASEFDGNYLTVGYEILRDGEKALVPFVRISEYQTHDTVDAIKGTQFGANYYLTDQFVLKADLLTEEQGSSENDTFSLGFGMMFQ